MVSKSWFHFVGRTSGRTGGGRSLESHVVVTKYLLNCMYLHKLNYKDKGRLFAAQVVEARLQLGVGVGGGRAARPARHRHRRHPRCNDRGCSALRPRPAEARGGPRRPADHSPGTDSEPVACGSPDSWSLSCSPSSSKICDTTASLQHTNSTQTFVNKCTYMHSL